MAITGTNGKTTVTGLVTAMLAASGMTAVAAGNVGYPLLDAVAALTRRTRAGDGPPATGEVVLVAEVSSFQLEYTHRFSPDVSCWLNFAPDHLDWHPNLEHYVRAKAKIGPTRPRAASSSSTPTTPSCSAVRRPSRPACGW